jgi:hypothetical protein
VLQVEVISPVSNDGLVNLASALVPHSCRIAPFALGAEDRLPNVPLPTAARMLPEDKFVSVHLLYRRRRLPIRCHRPWVMLSVVLVTIAWACRALPVRVVVVSVAVLVKVNRRIVRECDRVGAGGVRTVVLVRILDL